jgi:flagellar motor switch/type III secretory pathway protein FliN
MDSLDEANAPMSAEGSDAVLTTIGDALLSLRVEIATAVLPAREWAALGPGAIVMLGHRVGEPVVLRVGGVPVARGDLVEVDGQVGVRIIERVSDADCP